MSVKTLLSTAARVEVSSDNGETWHDISHAIAPKKYPTPRLIEGCLIKAADGDKRCQAIWERWEREADETMAERMLEAMSSWVHRQLGDG